MVWISIAAVALMLIAWHEVSMMDAEMQFLIEMHHIGKLKTECHDGYIDWWIDEE